ncbi:beta-galactosidase [Striga asiatica]|uniref:Beta-galactosidase n=1 Tax=Striga asiatica TaxID=4170 RepID=A0A5A7QPH2_STRAF|nr:beta-galactosidase [Striga asiatica]
MLHEYLSRCGMMQEKLSKEEFRNGTPSKLVNAWKADLFHHLHGRSKYLRERQGPIAQQQQKQRLYTADSCPKLLSFVEELYATSALRINPTCCKACNNSNDEKHQMKPKMKSEGSKHLLQRC